MPDIAIKIENISKEYRLGVINHGLLYRDLQSWWANFRGKEDPNSVIQAFEILNKNERFLALRNISLEVKKGEILGVIGRNGAGKSTLLKILSRVTAPTKGLVKIKGRIASLLEVGTGFHPELTGRKNIYLNGTILGMTKKEIDKKFDEIVAFAEVDEFIDTPVKRYSSGMYVRLAFAVAAHLEPEILLIDEVLAVGDAMFQKKCLRKIGDVADGGRTVLFVSHNMQAIDKLCSRAILLQAGELVIEDKPSTVIEYYLRNSNQQIDMEQKGIEEFIRNLPHDPAFKLEKVILLQNSEPVTQIVENGKPLEIEISYRVLKKTTGLRVYFDVCDEHETLLFRSFHDENSSGIPVVKPGYYTSKAIVPANLLAPINYKFRIQATIFNVRNILGEGLHFSLKVEHTGCYNRAYLGDTFRGKFALSIPWETSIKSVVSG